MQAISANRLADGIVVYAGHDGSWVERFAEARIFLRKPEADTGLLAAQNDVRRNLIVEPCLIEVCEKPGGLRPLTLREAIRAQGPTIDFLPRAPVPCDAKPAPEGTAKRGAVAVLRVPSRGDARANNAEEHSPA